MKKKLACMLLMSALALSMTACGGKDNNSAASDNQQSTMESTAAGQVALKRQKNQLLQYIRA